MATLQDLIDEYSSDLDDQETPYLWSSADLLRYINKAIEILCEKGLLISDASTAAVCTMSLSLLGGQSYTKHPKIIQVREIYLTGYTTPIIKKTLSWLGAHWPTWRSATAGKPLVFIEDYESGKVTFIPAPDQAYTANLSVFRYVLTDLSLSSLIASPEIHTRWHKYIKKGVLYQAYSKDDSEGYDPDRALKYEKEFMADCSQAAFEAYKLSYSSQTVNPHLGFM
jgi:hypothetical protein